MGTTPSSLAAAADALLQAKGTTLEAWLAEQVESGAGTRLIATRLMAATDEVVTPTHETIRRWCSFYGLGDEVAA